MNIIEQHFKICYGIIFFGMLSPMLIEMLTEALQLLSLISGEFEQLLLWLILLVM